VSRLVPWLGLAVAAALTALAVVVVASEREDDMRRVLGASGVHLDATLTPEIVFFGDTVHAVVDVTVDRSRWDPDSVRIGAQFSPWEVIGSPTRMQRDAGPLGHVRTTYVIRCMKSPCIPVGQASPLEIGSVQATVAAPGALEGQGKVFRTQWPLLVVYSRFASVGFEDPQTAAAPWRADLVSLPALSYRVSPRLLVGILLALSLLLVAAAAAIVYVAWPRRVPEPEPEPEPEPLPSLTPLEQALALLEESARVDGAGDQRRALELVAEELDAYGDADLAGKARVLAWSQDVPGVEQTNALAAQVREELEQELLARAALDRNGDGGED
jgi:hypothetical protein